MTERLLCFSPNLESAGIPLLPAAGYLFALQNGSREGSKTRRGFRKILRSLRAFARVRTMEYRSWRRCRVPPLARRFISIPSNARLEANAVRQHPSRLTWDAHLRHRAVRIRKDWNKFIFREEIADIQLDAPDVLRPELTLVSN